MMPRSRAALVFAMFVGASSPREGWAQACNAAAGGGGSAGSLATPPSSRPLRPALTGSVFVSHGGSGLVSILDLGSGAITTLDSGVEDPHEVAVSPDGRWGVAADFGNHTGNYNFDGRRLAVIDLAEKSVARIIDLGNNRGPHDVMFLPGSSKRLVVTTQTSRTVVEVDVETGQVIAATPTNAPGSHTLAVAADGRTAFTANQPEGSVSRIDLAAHALVRKFAIGSDPAEGIAVTPDGREVWVAFRGERVIRVIDGATGRVLATLPGFPSTERLAMTPDGRRVLIADLRCRDVKVADVATRRILGSIADLRDNAQAKILPDSRVAIVPLLSEGTVAVVDIDERRVLARHRFGRRIDAAGWGPTPAPGAR
jgi:DNA-binding beta-propeller fold protein YncE